MRDADGRIDRRALGALVWTDPAALKDLEAILHPGVRAEVRRHLDATTAPAIVVDAIKLIEGGLYKEMDAVWVVTCPRVEQIRRLVELRGMSEADARQRIAAQPPQSAKIAAADVVIDNSGTLDATERQVAAAWQQINRE